MQNWTISIWSFVLLLFSSMDLSGQVSSILESRAVEVGTSNALTLRVSSTDTNSIQFTPLTLDANLELLNEQDWKLEEAYYEKTWDLIAWDSGQYVIPAFEVNIGDQIFTSNSHNLMVGDLQLPDSTQLADIKPIIEEPETLEDYLPIVYFVLMILTLGFVIWYVYKRNKQSNHILDPPAAELKRPAHIIALEALRALDQMNLLEKEEQSAYQTELSLILRRYLSARFDISVLEVGNQVFIQMIEPIQDIPTELKSNLLEVLPEVELIKYAGQQGSADFHQQVRSLVGKIIDLTVEEQEQSFVLSQSDEILQVAIEAGLEREVLLGAIPELQQILLETKAYGDTASTVQLVHWSFQFPFIKSDIAKISLPAPIILWHQKGLSNFFSLYNKVGSILNQAGILGMLIFILLHPLFALALVPSILLDIIQGKKILGTGHILLKDPSTVRFEYTVLENPQNATS